MGDVLIVDDEPGLRGLLEVGLRREGHRITTAADGLAALAALTANPAIDVVLTDLRMDGLDGLGLLERVRAQHPDTMVLIMTAFAEWDTAVRAMRMGAHHFIRKPFDMVQVKAAVTRAIAAREHRLAARAAGEPAHPIHIVGSSPAIAAIQEVVERIAGTDSTVLVTGESGTGKELVARAVHYASLRSDGPLMRINSGALAPSLLESELFGHTKGAFTGAMDDRPGLFALADRGTLFLDEVGELAPETQIKLLRVLECGEYLPVGGREVRYANVRIVAATNRDLGTMVREGTFREDLYYRLAVIPIELPPLRERRDDIALLAGHLLARHAVRLRRGVGGFTPEALEAMRRHPWPGNIRELDNCIQRGVALTPSGDITSAALFSDLAGTRTPTPLPIVVTPPAPAWDADLKARLTRGEPIALEDELLRVERALVEQALETTRDNLTEAAHLLGISFRQIRYKVRQLGLR